MQASLRAFLSLAPFLSIYILDVVAARGSGSGACQTPQVRPEWRNMSATQQQAYLAAEQCLLGTPATTTLAGVVNRLDDFTAVHQQLTTSIHDNGVFLAWHRFLLHAHETALRTACSYTGPMPWWDEALDAGRFAASPLFTSDAFGSLPATADTCVTDGAFAHTWLPIGPGASQTNHCLARGVREDLSASITSHFVDHCNGLDDYAAMTSCVFHGPHAFGHNAVGGTMVDIDSSPGDPAFYMHHGMVDRNWRRWQQADPDGRLVVGGPTLHGCTHNCTNTTLDTPLRMLGIVPDVTIRDVIDTQGSMLCYEYDY